MIYYWRTFIPIEGRFNQQRFSLSYWPVIEIICHHWYAPPLHFWLCSRYNNGLNISTVQLAIPVFYACVGCMLNYVRLSKYRKYDHAQAMSIVIFLIIWIHPRASIRQMLVQSRRLQFLWHGSLREYATEYLTTTSWREDCIWVTTIATGTLNIFLCTIDYTIMFVRRENLTFTLFYLFWSISLTICHQFQYTSIKSVCQFG